MTILENYRNFVSKLLNEITDDDRSFISGGSKIVDEVNIDDYSLQLIKYDRGDDDIVYDIALSYKDLSIFDQSTIHHTGATLPMNKIVEIVKHGKTQFTDHPMVIGSMSLRKIKLYQKLFNKFSGEKSEIEDWDGIYYLNI